VRRLTFAGIAVLSMMGFAAAGELSGSARIIDGDTLEIAGTHVRLWGIDAPEKRQTCEGRAGAIYECGRDSAAVLRELIRGQPVTCEGMDIDRYGRTVAVCRTESGELNAAMVRGGWAIAYRRYSHGRYAAEEEAAREEHRGIWSGRFEMPDAWRRHH
jgi:endonuclease YncB( thermonuclease family)